MYLFRKAKEIFYSYNRTVIKNGLTDPWTFTSSDGRFEMKFEPIIDRSDYTSALGIIVTNQHQVFGRMTGKAVLDDVKVQGSV